VVEIKMDGPGMNCLGTTMMSWLLDQLSAAGGEPILLTGTGRAFSAGLDLREVVAFTPDSAQVFLDTLARLMRTLYEYPGPVVAWVNGHAIAGGCLLVMASDAAYAPKNPRIRIGLNEVAIGLRFPPGPLEMVRARLPIEHLEEVVLGAGLHAPEQAAKLGLIRAATDDPEGDAKAHLARLAAHPAHAFAAGKSDLRGGIMATSPDLTRRFQDEVLPLWTSPDLKAKLLALLER
jgi:enoyl-CoA hydratase/carnithine racemase